jgi:hypothetical protein
VRFRKNKLYQHVSQQILFECVDVEKDFCVGRLIDANTKNATEDYFVVTSDEKGDWRECENIP